MDDSEEDTESLDGGDEPIKDEGEGEGNEVKPTAEVPVDMI